MTTAAESARVTRQELVAHLFISADGSRADGGLEAVDLLLANCKTRLGTTVPIRRTGQVFLAAAESPRREAQVVVRRENEVINVSLLLSSDETAGLDDPTAWQRMDLALDPILEEAADDCFGHARLYLGQHGGDLEGVGTTLATLLPRPGQESGWTSYPPSVIGRLVAWELSPYVDSRAVRRIVVLDTADDDAGLSAWTWYGRDQALPPFARYLKHLAKVRYQLRVHSAAPSTGSLCRALEGQLLRLGDLSGDDVDRTLASMRSAQARATTRAALLKAMRRTVRIAAGNARSALGNEPPDSGTLFDDDRDLIAWFERQLENEIHYLEAALEGATRLSVLGPSPVTRSAAPEPRGGPVIGLVTAMPEEFAAMSAMIENPRRENIAGDRANYVVGTLPGLDPKAPHDVVLTLLGDTANDAAADGCANLARSFASVAVVLMVGIAAGVPDLRRPEKHVRLGDIVVSTWGIVDYDHVVDSVEGSALRQPFPRPSRLLAHHANWLAAEDMRGRRPWEALLTRAIDTALPEFGRPPADTDLVFLTGEPSETAGHPDMAHSGHRPGVPKVHHGYIGSADHALRDADRRAALAARYDLRAIEMEGKGIGDSGFAGGLEWLVIRGISDYGDSRTNNRWRKYASLTAAAYARALLAECPSIAARGGHTGAVCGPAASG